MASLVLVANPTINFAVYEFLKRKLLDIAKYVVCIRVCERCCVHLSVRAEYYVRPLTAMTLLSVSFLFFLFAFH